ncbi:MAG TPA: TaqI-like C-terminal specificity domain-containing protein, partial [Dehalococcoidales bacterium]|nr:TaqI-like C-terminal specificity domain-containing protein [Dehalococcoidales bacterium]
IIVPELSSTNRFAYCAESIFYLDTACGIVPNNKDYSTYLYLLGLLNSSLLEFYYKKTTVPKATGFYIYKTMFLKGLPIRRIDFNNLTEKKRHDDLVTLVDRMLELNKRLAPIRKTYCNERDELLKEIEQTDKEIDNIAYDLYGLTEEERKLVEGGL